MGFPSPAGDFVERRLTVDDYCRIDENCTVVSTSTGFAVIDRSLTPWQGATVLLTFEGRSCFARVKGKTLITADDQSITGEALDEVVVHGVLTFVINRVLEEDGPTV